MYLNEFNENLVKKISEFSNLILSWNKLSLVANSTLNDLWGWHFIEAFSVLELIKKNNCLRVYDFGAGGGVIGYPLYLNGFDVHFVERSYNKNFFLKKILRYDQVFYSIDDYSDGLVIVRGVGKILSLMNIIKGVKKIIFFKSLNYEFEIREAEKCWSFEYSVSPRIGNAKGYIIFVFNIFKKK